LTFNMLRAIILTLAGLAAVKAECPNACSGAGTCGKFDQCTCYPNYQGADCSLRTCPFELAHVDTPKGDLDGSADALSGPRYPVIQKSTVYPYGTTEQFPAMTDSIGQIRLNTAHYYMECGNKGICDRKSGECECFDGYEGAGCKRASCPNDCSGHGTCEHIKTLAELDYNNMYDLWDAEMTMGCSCDAGYYGPDCSSRRCPMGIDPLYLDDTTARVQTTNIKIEGVQSWNSPSSNQLQLEGTYAIKFYDVFGEDYLTSPIVVDAVADGLRNNCDAIVTALETLPNSVIPTDSVLCRDGYDPSMVALENELKTKRSDDDEGKLWQYNSTRMYSLTFTGNPGALKEIEIDMYLDGDRPTLYSTSHEVGANNDFLQFPGAIADVYTTGVSGEFIDYFANECEDVEVKIDGAELVDPYEDTDLTTQQDRRQAVMDYQFTSGYTLGDLTTAEIKRLKICLGDSDGYSSNNVEVYDWDYGSWTDSSYPTARDVQRMGAFPHAIKLVNHVPTSDLEGGNFYLTWWDPTSNAGDTDDTPDIEGKFNLVNPPSTYKTSDNSYFSQTESVQDVQRYHVYTTDGVVERVRHRCGDNAVLCHENEKYSESVAINAYVSQYSNVIKTQFDVSCETAPDSVQPCLDKGDLVFIVDTFYFSNTTSTFEEPDGKIPDPGELSEDVQGYTMPTYDTYESGNLYEIKKIYRDDTWTGNSNSTGVSKRFNWNNDYYNDYGAGDLTNADGEKTAQYDGSPSDTYLDRDIEDRFNIVLDKNVPFAADETFADPDLYSRNTWSPTDYGTRTVGMVNIFKFAPATTGTYTYVSECSNRGICDADAGVCECFKGHTNDDCSVQSSIAV